MAGVKEYSGADLNTISRLSGVSNVLDKINGVTVSAATLLLDTYTGAAAAYSVRKLRTAYAGSAIRVREDSGDTELDIGFDSNGDLDTAAIATHCGVNNGYVVTWYDQSGNANNATQSTNASQPQIYDGTAVITENGKPAIAFIQDELTTSQIWPAGSSDRAYSLVCTPNNSFNKWIVAHGHSGTATHFIITQEFFLRLGGGVTYDLTNAASTTQTHIFVDGSGTTLNDYTVSFNGAVEAGTRNSGTTTIATSNNVDTPSIGSATGNNIVNAQIQEIICWNSDESTNRTGIESDINTYFSIY